MKIAAIDQVGNPGGGSRYLRALLPALSACLPEAEIDYYGHPASIHREHSSSELSTHNIQVKILESLKSNTWFSLLGRRGSEYAQYLQTTYLKRLTFLPISLSGDLSREIENISSRYDLIFLAWPFFLEPRDLKCPTVCVFHDFNFRYFFGSQIFSTEQRQNLDGQTAQWLETTYPVCSSEFIASELKKFYPHHRHEVQVIRLAPFNISKLDDGQAQALRAQKLVQEPYLLYPTHLTAHKNIGPLISAISLLNAAGYGIRLYLTGFGTEHIKGSANSIGLQFDAQQVDVQGLGYVSNEEMDALIHGASIVVSSSLYEAGNGPGVDAWQAGVPVAMSNIPAFLEHSSSMNVKAQTFDPRSPADIASKIAYLLDNPLQAREDALSSKIAIEQLSWRKTAQDYAQLFKTILKRTL